MKYSIIIQYLFLIQLSISLKNQCAREDIDKLRCLPTENIIFFKKCSITQSIAIDKLNILAQECNYPWEIKNIQQRYKVYSKRNIQANQTILTIKEQHSITNKGTHLNLFFKSQYQMQHAQYQLPHYKEVQNLQQMLTLFYHLINYDSSFNKFDLLSLPYLPDNLLFLLTPQEQEVIKSIPLGQEVLQFKQYAKQAYLYFMEGLSKHFTKEQITSMFRGEFLNYDSFLYLCYIQTTQSIMKTNKNNNDNVIIFPPFFHFNYQQNSLSQNRVINSKKGLSIISKQTIPENSEINYQYKQMTNINYLLQYNYMPEQNSFNCINIILFQSKEKEQLPPIYCINLKTIQIYEAYFYLKAMDKESQQQCLGQNLYTFNLLKQYKHILGKCQRPENISQFWKFPMQNVKTLKREYKKVSKVLSKQLNSDQIYSNAKLILQFCKSELTLIKSLIEYISNKYFN